MPTPSMYLYNQFLSNYGVAGFQMNPDLVATKIFPIVHVDKQSGLYRLWDSEAMFRDDFEVLPLGTETAGTDFKWSSDTYFAARHGLHIDIDDAERSNTDADIDLETLASQTLGSKGRLYLERKVFASVFTTGVWGKDYTGVSGAPGANQFKQWNDATSTPIVDIQAGEDVMIGSTNGIAPNTLVVSQPVWRALQNHASVVARYSYVSDTSTLTTAQVAAVLGVDNIYVVRTQYTSNIEGATKASTATLGKVAWLGYIPPTLNQFTPAPATIFSWDGVGLFPGVTDTVPVSKIRMDPIHSDRIEAIMAFGVKVSAPALGVFFASAVA
jgi:hypothetical protein